MDQASKNILLTGSPGCGKTTVIRRLAERFGDRRLAGFYTQEMREQGQRVGFEAIGLSGQRESFAHVRSRSRQRVGRYGVEPSALHELVRAELLKPADEVDAFLIDEIGKMELLCPSFVAAVPRLLDGTIPVIATVALRGTGLIAAVKWRADTCLIDVSQVDRDSLPEKLESWLRERLLSR